MLRSKQQTNDMRNWMYDHIYIPLVTMRDRNHNQNGFTWKGHIWQFLVVAYGKIFFALDKRRNNCIGSNSLNI